MVRVLIADDHEVVRRGIRALLETRPDFDIGAEARDGREACQKILELRPDVAVMDVSMPEMSGIDSIRLLTGSGCRTEVLALTMHSSETLARELIEAGARGYVLKSDAARDLISAVDTLANHRSFLTPATSNIILDEFRRIGSPQNDRHQLSKRERETLELLSEGKSNKEIAQRMFLSVRTVETHRANIMAKLNLHSIGELVHYALRHDIGCHMQSGFNKY
jgi:DNA-binding NarL/FixJ family response regulator